MILFIRLEFILNYRCLNPMLLTISTVITWQWTHLLFVQDARLTQVNSARWRFNPLLVALLFEIILHLKSNSKSVGFIKPITLVWRIPSVERKSKLLLTQLHSGENLKLLKLIINSNIFVFLKTPKLLANK